MKRTELNDSTGVVFLQEIKGRKCKSGAEIIKERKKDEAIKKSEA